MRILSFTAALFLLLYSNAHAEMTGNNLKEYCSFYPRHTESTTLCMGYISGTLDMVRERKCSNWVLALASTSNCTELASHVA